MAKGWWKQSSRHALARKGIKTGKKNNLTMADVKRINREKGRYWFSPDTMSFFKSRIESQLFDNKYFITSEKAPHRKRKYSIRKFNKKTGAISTVGEFNQYSSIAEAKGALKRIRGVSF